MDSDLQSNMSNSRDYRIHILTIVLVICTPLYILPNLSTDLKNYYRGQAVLKQTRINEREYTGRLFDKRVERTLILDLDDGTELRLSGQYYEYWGELQDKESIGKIVTYYLGNNTAYGSNPVQIELNNKIIYDTTESIKWGYLIVLATIACMMYSGFLIYKSVKSKQKSSLPLKFNN